MRRRLAVPIAVALLFLGLGVVTSPSVAAHKHILVDRFEFVLGWTVEPPTVGVRNGLDLGVSWHENGTAVLFAHQNLTATLMLGSDSYAPPLRPQFGVPGWYTFDVIPTEPGNYSLRVTGNEYGTAIDFTTADIEDVSPASEMEFPATTPTPGDLQAQVAALQGQLTVLLAVAVLGVLLAAASTATAVMIARRVRKGP